MQKNFPSAFKHVISMRKEDEHEHPGEEKPIVPATATPQKKDSSGTTNHDWEKNLNDLNNEGKISNVQKVQSFLTGVELIPDVHPLAAAASSVAGVANGFISLTRSGLDYAKGDKEKGWSNLVDAGLSYAGAAPVAGYGATLAKVAGKYGQARHLDDLTGNPDALNVPKFKDSFFGGAYGYLKNKMK